MDPYLIHGDTTWASPELMELIKEDFPFLRDSVIEPLPSPRNNFSTFFKAEPHGVFALYESEFLYYLGKDTDEAEERYQVVKAHGWDFSDYRMVEPNGELDDGMYLRLGFWGHIYSKTLVDPDTRLASLAAFEQEVIDGIEEIPPGFFSEWKSRMREGTRAVLKKLANVASEVAFVELRLTSCGNVYLRWTDENGGVGHRITLP